MTDAHNTRPRVTYSQELRDSIGQLLANQADMKVSQAKLEANQTRSEASQNALTVQIATLPSRQEIAAEFDKRVSSVAYQSDREALVGRIKRLEDAPQNMWAKIAVIVSILSVVVTTLIATHAI